MTALVAVPSRGRLRDFALTLLQHAGYSLADSPLSTNVVDDVVFVEMRSRDAAAWLRAGKVAGAFISTDLVHEEDLLGLESIRLGSARSELVVASRSDDARTSIEDLRGGVVATHLPRLTERWFAEREIDVTIIPMHGSLEGICVAGLADAIADLRSSGLSIAKSGLRVLDKIMACEGLLTCSAEPSLRSLKSRVKAVLHARGSSYIMLHLHPSKVEMLSQVFPGLTAPTLLPLSSREDLVAVHIVVKSDDFWANLPKLARLGATDIVSLPPMAIAR